MPKNTLRMNRTLRFRRDGSFTIVQFTDTHFENGRGEDRLTSALMAQVLDLEQPDLVILTGDVIGGHGENDAQAAWRSATAPLLERNVPWCAVFGNHDDECGSPREHLLAIQRDLPGCLTQPGPGRISGLGNYLLQICKAKGKGVAAVLCCLDSNSYAETDIGGYGWVREDQVHWFSQAMRRLTASPASITASVLVFLHIPLPEYDEVWSQGNCQGEKNEAVCCPSINTGLFAAMHISGNVRGVFVGHDHLNDFEGNLHNIRLCYGRATGYNAYGRDDFLHGARIIRLQENKPGFTTWIRLDDGSRIDRPITATI